MFETYFTTYGKFHNKGLFSKVLQKIGIVVAGDYLCRAITALYSASQQPLRLE